eukprot:164180-Pelagomonas_calceolata.AAC.1
MNPCLKELGLCLPSRGLLSLVAPSGTVQKGTGYSCEDHQDFHADGDFQPDCLADQHVAGPCQPTANPKAQTC